MHVIPHTECYPKHSYRSDGTVGGQNTFLSRLRYVANASTVLEKYNDSRGGDRSLYGALKCDAYPLLLPMPNRHLLLYQIY